MQSGAAREPLRGPAPNWGCSREAERGVSSPEGQGQGERGGLRPSRQAALRGEPVPGGPSRPPPGLRAVATGPPEARGRRELGPHLCEARASVRP